MRWADYVGRARRQHAVENNFKGHNQDTDPELRTRHNVIGAQSEYAVAKFFGVHWSHSIGEISNCDLGKDVQIRSTEHPRGRLMIRDRDTDWHRFIFVLKKEDEFDIRGWIEAREGKKKEYYESPTGKWCDYFIPHDKLRPMNLFITK